MVGSQFSVKLRQINLEETYLKIYIWLIFFSPYSANTAKLVKLRKMLNFRQTILAFFAILPILSYLHFGTFLHEKMRHFIIVMEKYTKNDGNQNINGFNKVHEKYISWNQLTLWFISKNKFSPKNFQSKNGERKIRHFPHGASCTCPSFAYVLTAFSVKSISYFLVLLE